MATHLAVEIVTPERSAFSGTASEVVLPAWEGELGVYPDHDALLTLVRPGSCQVATPSGTLRYVIGRGFAEIGPTSVTILTDSCEEVAKIDKAGASRDLHTAEQEMASSDAQSEKYRQARLNYEHALARLDA